MSFSKFNFHIFHYEHNLSVSISLSILGKKSFSPLGYKTFKLVTNIVWHGGQITMSLKDVFRDSIPEDHVHVYRKASLCGERSVPQNLTGSKKNGMPLVYPEKDIQICHYSLVD